MSSALRLIIVFSVLCLVQLSTCARWAHSAYLSPDYRLLWSLGPGPQDITFELQVRTLGYVGFGFSKDGRMAGADMVVGWVDHGQVYFQVSLYIFRFVLSLLWHVYKWQMFVQSTPRMFHDIFTIYFHLVLRHYKAMFGDRQVISSPVLYSSLA